MITEHVVVNTASQEILTAIDLMNMATRDKYKKELEIIKCIITMCIVDFIKVPREKQDQSDINIEIVCRSFLMKVRSMHDSEFEKVMFEIQEFNKKNIHRLKR